MPASVFKDAPPIDLDPDGKSKPLSLSAMCGHRHKLHSCITVPESPGEDQKAPG